MSGPILLPSRPRATHTTPVDLTTREDVSDFTTASPTGRTLYRMRPVSATVHHLTVDGHRWHLTRITVQAQRLRKDGRACRDTRPHEFPYFFPFRSAGLPAWLRTLAEHHASAASWPALPA